MDFKRKSLVCVLALILNTNLVLAEDRKLLAASSKELMFMNIDGTNHEVIVHNDMYNIRSIAYHETRKYIYFTEYQSGNITRFHFPSDDYIMEVIVQQNSGHVVSGITVDYINDYLYWTNSNDSSDGKILRSNLDGSDITLILDSSSYGSLGILEVDLINGWIYFINALNGSIYRCMVDGSDLQLYFSSWWIYDIAIDNQDQRIYFSTSHSVGSTTHDGSDLRTIPIEYRFWSGHNRIELSGDDIFYSDNYLMYRATKNNSQAIWWYVDDTVYAFKIYEKRDCEKYTAIKNEEKRSKDYLTDLANSRSTSDEYLDDKWYRIFSANGDQMPSHPPGIMHCGAIYPIWLNGTLPTEDDGNVGREACVQTENAICKESVDLEIRNCGGYYIYFLQETPANSSFCFGSGPVACPVGTSSETGFYPGCSSIYPKTVVSLAVQAELLEGSSFQIPGYDPTPSLLPVFRCKFDGGLHETYIYDIVWYINGNITTSYANISKEGITNTLLKHTDWIDDYKMNMEVQCAVRMRYFVNSVPGPFYYSEKFKAGLFPEKYEYTVIEGESITISFKSTVPAGCIASHKEIMTQCDQSFYAFQPTKNSNFGSCSNNIALKDIIFKAQFCGIKIGSTDWQNEKKLEVYGFSDGLYNSKFRSTYVRLSTSTVSALNEMWQSVKIPDIKVTVIDKDMTLANRLCQSYNYLHIRTFDGKYYDMMEVGEFVLYRNDKGPYWVNVLFTNCGFGRAGASCNCGIAVRSRSSLFVLRTCAVVSRTKQEILKTPLTKLISCNENDLLINYNQRRNEYTITLPTGTEINVRISWRFIGSVSIKPSTYDINEVKGLCGVPSITKDPSDDYTDRETGPVISSQEFSKSWRITSAMENEQLFVQEPGFINDEFNVDLENTTSNKNNLTATTFCYCENQASSTESLEDFNIMQCNLTERTEFCASSSQSGNQINSYATFCTISKRKRRSVNNRNLIRRNTVDIEDSDDIIDYEPLVFDEDINSTDVISKTFRNGWTVDVAYQTCQEALTTAIPSDVYIDFVEIDVENFIQSCVSDIEVTGDTSFLTDTINAMATTILMEVSRNESLFIINTTDGSQTIFEQITSKLCINNCSNNGICVSGGCECSNGYIGDDCSKDIAAPPINISLPADGLCTTSTRACRKTNIYGDFLSTKIWFKIRYFKVVDNSKAYSSNWEVNTAEYRNMFMVTVELSVARKTRATAEYKMAEGYDITLSNDGTNFGDEVTILIYDDGCFSCNRSLTCVSLEVCESSIQSQEKDKDSNKTIIALASSFGVICVVVCLLVILFYWKHKNSDKKTKVGIYSGCQHESGEYVDNDMLSDRTKTFREYSISDLDLYIEDGGDASVGNFEKQHPPQTHFKNNL